MKTTHLLLFGWILVLSACGTGNGDYDASGVFEATEVIVSARNTGEIMQFDVEEGRQVKAGKTLGCIDTVQLHLKRLQLLAGMQSADSRRYDVPRQVASLRQQIATQRNERVRFENLVHSGAANRKQLDDINAQIAMLEKQLAAQTETLENGNRSIAGERLGLDAQVEQVEDQIRKSLIVSPINGTVLAKYAEPGELAIQGRSLFKVADMEHMFLRAYITADQLTSLKIGQKVSVYADRGSEGRKEYPGVIVRIADNAEFTPKTIQTRDERANLVYAVKVAVNNDGYIKRGMYGEMKINKP